MAKHLEKFTAPFRHSQIPFLLTEILTNGQGDMVDLVFRFVNAAAAALLEVSPETLTGKRFTRLYPADQLNQFAPLQSVAFSGSAAALTCTTVLGRPIQLICYQPMYGLVACILDSGDTPALRDEDGLPDQLPDAFVVLELSRAGVRCLSFSQKLCAMTGRERKELADVYAEDFSTLVCPEDWPGLLQELLDAVREQRSVDREFRLQQRNGPDRWIQLRAEPISPEKGTAVFRALLLDVDARYRAQLHQQEQLRQLREINAQFSRLFDALPGGCGVFFREAPAEPLLPLRLSRGLSRLLGIPPQELLEQLAADPLALLSAGDRTALSAAAEKARAADEPLQTACQIQTPLGDRLCLLLKAVWQPCPDGSCLLYVSCTDITEGKAVEAELQFRSRLCDLLLDDPHLISFDYDPAADTARISACDAHGRRSTRVIPDYLRDLENAPAVHPEDRPRLCAAIRRASAQPTTDVVEYRGDYAGLGWRWYRISWISLFDRTGTVYRLLGKAEDITRRKAAARLFHDRRKQQETLIPPVLATAQLDLTEDRILDAKGCTRHVERVLFGNTADACLRHLRDNLQDENQRRRFDRCFRRSSLLEAFQGGQLRQTLNLRFSTGEGAPLWAKFSAELTEDPDTGHIAAFCTVTDIDRHTRQEELLTALALRDYALVLTVDIGSGSCRSWGRPLPENCRVEGDCLLLGDRSVELPAVLEALHHAPLWTTSLPDGMLRCSWQDETDGLLLVTLST